MIEQKPPRELTPTEATDKAFLVSRKTQDLLGDGSMLARLRKALVRKEGEGETNQGVASGTRPHLINKRVARDLRDFNPVHSTCLDAKESATVGLGHRDEEIHKVLDPLCTFSWQDVLDACGVDFWETGECFIEAVVDPENEFRVLGLHHLESLQVEVEVEEDDRADNFHYVVNGETGAGKSTVMARWGDLKALRERFNSARPAPTRRTALVGEIVDSVVIHIRQSNNRSRYYGYPDYMSAVPSAELVQCMTQHEFDFYFNRGVPEFLMFLIGRQVTKEAWNEIKSMIQASQGLGNSHKTGAVHIAGT